MRRVNDPHYCNYHQDISHPVEKCFVLKELILKLALNKKIELDLDDVAQTNHTAVIIHSNDRLPATRSPIQFRSLDPIIIYFSLKALQNNDLQTVGYKEEEKQIEDIDER